jgi:methylmalonyl-CoA mutase, N-terminal domain
VTAIAFMQREIHDAAYRYQREIEEGARIVVGVNEFVTDEPPPGNLFQVDAALGKALRERVLRLRARRDRDRADRALDALAEAARGGANLMPLIVEAVEALVTLGEICDRLRGEFGTYQPTVTV